MIIECPSCSARFNLDDSKVPAQGVKVRCSKCQHVFTATKHAPAGADKTIAPGGAGAPPPPPPAPPSGDSDPFGSDADFDFGDSGADATSGSDEDFGFDDDLSFNDDTGETTGSGVSNPPGGDVDDFGDFDFGDEPATPPSPAATAAPTGGPPAAPPDEWGNVSFEDVPDTPPGGGAGLDDGGFDLGMDAPAGGGPAAAPAPPPPPSPPHDESFGDFSFSEEGADLPLEERPRSRPSAADSLEASIDQPDELATPTPAPAPMPPPGLGAAEGRVMAPRMPARSAPKGGGSSAKWLVLIIFLLVLGGAGGYLYTQGLLDPADVPGSVARIEEWAKKLIGAPTPPKQEGRLSIRGIKGKRIMRDDLSLAVLITGSVYNEFEVTKGAVEIEAIVPAADGSITVRQKAYCGNPISAADAQELDRAELEDIMSNELGQGLSNLELPAGASIDFSVVVFDVPEEIGKPKVLVASFEDRTVVDEGG